MVDLIIVIVAGCDAMNTTVRIGYCASRPSGLDRRQSYRGVEQRTDFVLASLSPRLIGGFVF